MTRYSQFKAGGSRCASDFDELCRLLAVKKTFTPLEERGFTKVLTTAELFNAYSFRFLFKYFSPPEWFTIRPATVLNCCTALLGFAAII